MEKVKIVTAAEKTGEHSIKITLDVSNLNGVNYIIQGFKTCADFAKGSVIEGVMGFISLAGVIWARIKAGKNK